MKWKVQKCKKPSTRWVAWRLRSKKKTGEVFTSWKRAFVYARCMAYADTKLKEISE